MTTNRSATLPVLVVGATGSLGGKVVDELLERGKKVRALVRPTTDASRLESRGVEIARGDMLDLDSLVAAMNGADAVITTAAGYTRGGKNAHDIDTVGNANLAEAAHRAGIRRFVLTSILTCDQTPDVPHFWHKKIAEDKLEQLGVPFVALRPGAFIDGVDVVCVPAAAGVSGRGGDHGIRPLHGGDEVRPHDHHTPDTTGPRRRRDRLPGRKVVDELLNRGKSVRALPTIAVA
jgi:uncharacterized protein YbjT (DUF2867 family)